MAQLFGLVFLFSILSGGLALLVIVFKRLKRGLFRILSKKTLGSARSNNSQNTPAQPKIAAPPPLEPALPPPLDLTLADLDWEQFEILVGEIYRRQGYTVELSSGTGADGGIDLKLVRLDEVVLVQCKHWKVYKVPVKDVREFFGILTAEQAHRGIFVTTGKFSRDAREWAQGKPITLLERTDLELLVSRVQRPDENLFAFQPWLDEFVAASRITDPTCPNCRRQMVLRQSGNKPQFWGCSGYPRCRGRRDARIALLRHRAYQPR